MTWREASVDWREEEVALDKVDISAFNTRKDLSAGQEDARIENLALSISSKGLLQLPVLRPALSIPGRYEVVAGQRRILACQRLGLATIRVRMRTMTDAEALEVSLIENVQRADMDRMDKAQAYDALRKMLGSVEEVARETGVSAPTVEKYLRLLRLPDDLQSKVRAREGPAGVGMMSELATVFSDSDDMREAYEELKGFGSGTAERIIIGSEGDLGRLRELKEATLRGEFGVKYCGSGVDTCPFIPPELRPRVSLMIAEFWQWAISEN